jgi:hypothetical protein
LDLKENASLGDGGGAGVSSLCAMRIWRSLVRGCEAEAANAALKSSYVNESERAIERGRLEGEGCAGVILKDVCMMCVDARSGWEVSLRVRGKLVRVDYEAWGCFCWRWMYDNRGS